AKYDQASTKPPSGKPAAAVVRLTIDALPKSTRKPSEPPGGRKCRWPWKSPSWYHRKTEPSVMLASVGAVTPALDGMPTWYIGALGRPAASSVRPQSPPAEMPTSSMATV